MSNKVVFVRLGGFHQLMSFLGSIGSLMEGSGLRRPLETVYVPLTVGNMMTGKAYTRAVRGHMMSASAVLSLLLEEFWDSLTTDEQAQLVKIYDSPNPEEYKNDPIAVHVMRWFTTKNEEVCSKSRTAALWLNYVHYIEIVQQFITAERTSNFALHISTTKQMINLFAATAHNNYAKTCRLYLQSVDKLEKDHPQIFKQFSFGNYTVRRTDMIWSGLWTDLSIEQILMKSLKGRGGVIGKGMTEIVLNVWTKTMHRSAEVIALIQYFMWTCFSYN